MRRVWYRCYRIEERELRCLKIPKVFERLIKWKMSSREGFESGYGEKYYDMCGVSWILWYLVDSYELYGSIFARNESAIESNQLNR